MRFKRNEWKRRFVQNQPSAENPWVYDWKERHRKRVAHAAERLDELKKFAAELGAEFKVVQPGEPGMGVQLRRLFGSRAAIWRWLPGPAKVRWTPHIGVVGCAFVKVYDIGQAMEQAKLWSESVAGYSPSQDADNA